MCIEQIRAWPRPEPAQTGTMPWTFAEEAALLAGFDSGVSINALAIAHKRTVAAIAARLEKHNLVVNRDGRVYRLVPVVVDWAGK